MNKLEEFILQFIEANEETNGVEVQPIIEIAASRLDAHPDDTSDAIGTLLQEGLIYEPILDRLKTTKLKEEKKMSYSKEDLQRVAKMKGMDISNEEYEKFKALPIKSALIAIKNVRDGVLEKSKGEKIKALLLGAKDFTRKTIPLETTKSQTVLACIEEPVPETKTTKYLLKEYTKFGTLTDAAPGDGVELTINHTIKTVGEITYDNYVINDYKVLQKGAGTPKLLDDIADRLGICQVDDIKPDDLITVSGNGIVIEGAIVNVEQQPIWEEDGSITKHYPFWYNDQPCFRFGLSMGSGENKIRVNLRPSKLSRLYNLFLDLPEIAQQNDKEMVQNALIGRWIRVFGSVVKYTEGTPTYYEVDAFCVQEVDEPVKEAPPASATPAPAATSAPAPAPASSPVQERARNKASEAMELTRQAYEMLGDQITTQSAIALGLYPVDIKEPLVAAAIERVKKEAKK